MKVLESSLREKIRSNLTLALSFNLEDGGDRKSSFRLKLEAYGIKDRNFCSGESTFK